MKLSQRLQDQAAFVKEKLADSVICSRCGATLHTYSKTCNVELSDQCPGFLAIETAKKQFDDHGHPGYPKREAQ